MMPHRLNLLQVVASLCWGLCLVFFNTNCGTEVGNGRGDGGITPPQSNAPEGETNTSTEENKVGEMGEPAGSDPSPVPNSVTAEAQTDIEALWTLVALDPRFLSLSCEGKNLVEELNKTQPQTNHHIVLSPRGLTTASSVTFTKLSSTRMQQKNGATETGYLDFTESGTLSKIYDASNTVLSSARFSCSAEAFSYSKSFANSAGYRENSVLNEDSENGMRFKILWFVDTQVTQGSVKQIEVISSAGVSLLVDVLFD